MKLSVPQATVGSAGVQQVSVGQVKIGAARIGQLTLSGLKLEASTGMAQLRNVRVALTMLFALDWTAGLVIDAGPFGRIDFSQSGTLDLGRLEMAIGLGDVGLPGLAKLALDVPDLALSDLPLVVGAIKNLKLGALLAERVKAQGLVAPKRGFQLDGLGLGSAGVEGLTLADAKADSVTVGKVTGGSLPLPAFSIPGLAFPQVAVPHLASRKVDVDTNPVVTPMPEADIGLLKAQLTVTTTAHLEIDELRLDDIEAAASIGEIVLKDVELPYEILDLTLSQVGIDRIGVPSVKVS